MSKIGSGSEDRASPQAPSRPGWSWRVPRLAAISTLLCLLPGCQGITGYPVVSLVRVIDASPDAGGLDVYQESGILAYNLRFGTVTSYVAGSPGSYTMTANTAGTRQVLTSRTGALSGNTQYTVLIGSNLASLHETVLQDQSGPAPAGQVSLRFLHESMRSGAVDLYLIPSGSTLSQVKPLLTGLAFGQNAGYSNVPAGTYTLAAVPAGTLVTAATVSSFTGASVTYGSGSARTIVLIDQPVASRQGLQVIMADDYEPLQAQ